MKRERKGNTFGTGRVSVTAKTYARLANVRARTGESIASIVRRALAQVIGDDGGDDAK